MDWTTAVLLCFAAALGIVVFGRRHLASRSAAEDAMKKMNARLNQSAVERTAELTELSRYLIQVTEKEKAALARELHDALGSHLTAINMDLKWIEERLPESVDAKIRERLQRALQILAATVELKRDVVEGLRPSSLDTLGVGHAMRMHCEEFTRRTGVPCAADVIGEMKDLDSELSIALYRIAQESLTNVAKHAQAVTARIHLEREAEGVRLCIIDDGVGVPADVMSKVRAHGLIGMRERVRQLGGTLTVGPQVGELRGGQTAGKGTGTIVEAFIPLKSPQVPDPGPKVVCSATLEKIAG